MRTWDGSPCIVAQRARSSRDLRICIDGYFLALRNKMIYQVGRPLVPRGFVKCFLRIENSPGCWAVLLLHCCPSKQGELSENLLPKLGNKWLPHLVEPLKSNVLRHMNGRDPPCFDKCELSTKERANESDPEYRVTLVVSFTCATIFRAGKGLQGDPSGRFKPPVVFDLKVPLDSIK